VLQRVLFNERRAGTRQRTRNHYLKGLLWCGRASGLAQGEALGQDAGIREERGRVQERLAQADSPVDSGYELLSTVLGLLTDPQALYVSHPTNQEFLNKAIFGKLFTRADELGPLRGIRSAKRTV